MLHMLAVRFRCSRFVGLFFSSPQGNTWAGGTGGRDTAGLGGVGGPYRLDKGHDVHQVSDEIKRSVPQDVLDAARKAGREALEQKLRDIEVGWVCVY